MSLLSSVHKNLTYLWLNSRQARFFLGWFDFTLTYHLGSKNTKPDALLRQVANDPSTHDPRLILPPTCIVGEVEEQVREVQCSATDPGGGSPKPLLCSGDRPL